MPRRNRRVRRRSTAPEPTFWTPREMTTEEMAARLVTAGLASPLILHDAGRGTQQNLKNRRIRTENNQ